MATHTIASAHVGVAAGRHGVGAQGGHPGDLHPPGGMPCNHVMVDATEVHEDIRWGRSFDTSRLTGSIGTAYNTAAAAAVAAENRKDSG